MEKINLSEPDGTRQRWVDGAIRESALLGRAISISEYVRRAVACYAGERAADRFRELVEPTPDEGVYRLTELGEALSKHPELRQVDTTPAGWGARPVLPGGTGPQARRPYSKERQTGKKVKP